MYVVYTELLNDKIERYYYGSYDDENRANEIALELGNNFPVFHCVCRINEVKDLNILNFGR